MGAFIPTLLMTMHGLFGEYFVGLMQQWRAAFTSVSKAHSTPPRHTSNPVQEGDSEWQGSQRSTCGLSPNESVQFTYSALHHMRG